MERTLERGDTIFKVTGRTRGDRIEIVLPDGERAFHWETLGPGDYLLRDGGRLKRCIVARQGDERWIWIAGHIHHFKVVSGPPRRRGAGAAGSLVAPMPGQVVKVLAAAGQPVTKGQPLVILEAMKMQCEIVAPREGTVASVSVAEGDRVAGGAELVVLEEDGDGAAVAADGEVR